MIGFLQSFAYPNIISLKFTIGSIMLTTFTTTFPTPGKHPCQSITPFHSWITPFYRTPYTIGILDHSLNPKSHFIRMSWESTSFSSSILIGCQPYSWVTSFIFFGWIRMHSYILYFSYHPSIWHISFVSLHLSRQPHTETNQWSPRP